MRSAILSAAAVCCTAVFATKPSLRVYAFDPNPNDDRTLIPSPPELSPIAARMVLAQRAGVEDYHSSDLSHDGVIDAINTFGASNALFTTHQQPPPYFLYFPTTAWEEWISHPDRLFVLSNTFTISPSPSAQSAWDLFFDLAEQFGPGSVGSGGDDKPLRGNFFVVRSEEQLGKMVEHSILAHRPLTILVAPDNDATSQPINGDAQLWGTYAMPDSQVHLFHKREQPTQEEPLEIEEDSDSNHQPVSQSSNPTAFETLEENNQSNPLPGILPACFPSQKSCESITRNCTGHGSCSLKYTNPDTDSKSPHRECYACSCSATVSKDGEGRVSTTYWGGPACQKRDISMQFWLIVLFSVGMVFLISFAVGSVWSMGSEELPSVIGAGVSGPTARR